MTDDRPLREIVAREVYDEEDAWGELPEFVRESWLRSADCAIAAMFGWLEEDAKSQLDDSSIFSVGVFLSGLKAARTAAEKDKP